MKAYKVYDEYNHEGYQDVVFATTANEAKKKAFISANSCQNAEWIDIRVNRVPYLDGLEKRTHEEIMYVAILNGWWYEFEDVRYDEENIGEAIKKGAVVPYKTIGDDSD
ncbi:MAG TPA: hypothetical protein VK094_00230 [Pseudogracilibacillus sp.]|nr:hypothetical protein [Pseudogracilibacillus sp.]